MIYHICQNNLAISICKLRNIMNILISQTWSLGFLASFYRLKTTNKLHVSIMVIKKFRREVNNEFWSQENNLFII